MSKQGTSNPSQTGDLVGRDSDTQKVEDVNSDLLAEIVTELKILNKYLSIMVEADLEDTDL